MERFRDFRKDTRTLRENKDRFIQKSTVLTDEQKEEVLDFFHSHANLENNIRDWRYDIPYETFRQIIGSVDTNDKRLKKQSKELRGSEGLDSLEEGKDYEFILREGDIVVYRLLTHRGSRVISSNMVEPKLWCRSARMKWTDKEILPKGEPMKDGNYPGAKWCISMETDSHWRSYSRKGYMFFVVCDPNAEEDIEKKVCVRVNSHYVVVDVTTADDRSSLVSDCEGVGILMDYLKELRQKNGGNDLESLFNPTTGRYDHVERVMGVGELMDTEDFEFLVPLGVWEGDFNCSSSGMFLNNAPQEVIGNFDCSNNDLESLEGAPQKVSGWFDCSGNEMESLEDGPREVGGDYLCRLSGLVSLEGAPSEVGGEFDCSCNDLESLIGAPQVVHGVFDCSENPLSSLEGLPREAEGYILPKSVQGMEGAPQGDNVQYK